MVPQARNVRRCVRLLLHVHAQTEQQKAAAVQAAVAQLRKMLGPPSNAAPGQPSAPGAAAPPPATAPHPYHSVGGPAPHAPHAHPAQWGAAPPGGNPYGLPPTQQALAAGAAPPPAAAVPLVVTHQAMIFLNIVNPPRSFNLFDKIRGPGAKSWAARRAVHSAQALKRRTLTTLPIDPFTHTVGHTQAGRTWATSRAPRARRCSCGGAARA